MADFTSRFNELLTRTPRSDTEIAAFLGVSKQTISAWKNGVRFPKRPALRTIADYFCVSVPWLTGITDNEAAGLDPSAVSSLALDNNESELLSIYRSLNAAGQTTLMNVARGLSVNDDTRKDDGLKIGTA